MTSPEPPLTADITPAPDDAAGIADLFRARHVDLVRLATLLVEDQATAEDVVQDVFTRVCARAERLSGDGLALSYFLTAVVNACRSVHRRRGIARRFGGSAEAQLWAERAPSPEATVLLTEDRRQVLQALAALRHRQQPAVRVGPRRFLPPVCACPSGPPPRQLDPDDLVTPSGQPNGRRFVH